MPRVRFEQEITVPADPQADANLFIEDKQGITPSPVPFRAFAEGNILETEPNDELKTATAAELPLAFNGRMQKKGDADCFKFAAKKGQVWEIECYARRIGSPMDPVFTIYKDDASQVAHRRQRRCPWPGQLPALASAGRRQLLYSHHRPPGAGRRHVRLPSRDDARKAAAHDRHSACRAIWSNAADRRHSAGQSLRRDHSSEPRRLRRSHRVAAEEFDPGRYDDCPADASEHNADASRIRSG